MKHFKQGVCRGSAVSFPVSFSGDRLGMRSSVGYVKEKVMSAWFFYCKANVSLLNSNIICIWIGQWCFETMIFQSPNFYLVVLVSIDDYPWVGYYYVVVKWFSISSITFTFISWFALIFLLLPLPLKKLLVSLCIYEYIFQFDIVIISSHYLLDAQTVPDVTGRSLAWLVSVSLWRVLISVCTFSMAHPDTSGLTPDFLSQEALF